MNDEHNPQCWINNHNVKWTSCNSVAHRWSVKSTFWVFHSTLGILLCGNNLKLTAKILLEWLQDKYLNVLEWSSQIPELHRMSIERPESWSSQMLLIQSDWVWKNFPGRMGETAQTQPIPCGDYSLSRLKVVTAATDTKLKLLLQIPLKALNKCSECLFK